MPADLEDQLAALVEGHVRDGAMPDFDRLGHEHPEWAPALKSLFEQYLAVAATLDAGPVGAEAPVSTPREVTGFRTVERIGAGGMGEVYKLQDLTLHRFVAAKFVRPDARVRAGLSAFLREARSLALFKDSRIVQIFEFRDAVEPPVIIMEFVDGFELGKLGPSLEFLQRARIVRDVCEALQGAHDLGVQHRDLKPSNIMVDGTLAPKILDFGLSGGDPDRGHFLGTLPYLAPEQIDPSSAIDARTDVYALGVILYELLAGAAPYGGDDTASVMAAIRAGTPRLPVEVDPRVPEPLQAIALKAMERRSADRYQSAREMAADLSRYLEGLPVAARPTQYSTTLDVRSRAHLEQIGEWRRLNLIYQHEAERLRLAYRSLAAREDDWIAAARTLSYSQIALYFGALLLMAGGLFYFAAHRFFNVVTGVGRPFVVLATPFLGLNAAGWYLYRTERKAVAVAFLLAGVGLVPLFLLIWFHEAGFWVVEPDRVGQLFSDGSISNRQLQVTVGVATVWSGFLALRTRTAALSTVSAALAFVFTLAVLTDFGLRNWLQHDYFDSLAIHLGPLALAYLAGGALLERAQRPWFARPLYLAAIITTVAVLDLLALNGRAFHFLGATLQGWQSARVTDPVLIDTIGALSLNGLAFYLIGSLLERHGPDLMKAGAMVLLVIAPFSTLEPLAYLVGNGEYSMRFDWIYLTLAVLAALVSHARQRRSFYYAGLINTSVALYWIADHRHWMDKTVWATTLVAVGLMLLGSGFLLDARERRADMRGPNRR